LLETGVNASKDLDPYIVWYNGRRRLSEGRISEGAGCILWKAGDQTGFNTIRAEIFPFVPDSELRGYSREISLMISAKAEDGSAFREEEKPLVHWYQFGGNLHDALSPTTTEKALVPKAGLAPKWLPAEGIYGLSVGPGDAYLLEDLALSAGMERAAGRLLIRFRPVAEGTILNAAFTLEHSSETPEIILFCDRENLHFLVRTSLAAKTFSAPLSQRGGFISAVIDFTVDSGNFGAGLVSENAVFPPLILPLAESGEKTVRFKESFWLGGPMPEKTAENPVPDAGVSAAPELFPEQGAAVTGAIIDEFAVSAILPAETAAESFGPF
ncbi:MAG: hypothetical protein LBG42_09645, partial [Treponema sp.]|nr:hypothetical protein [Treponema sp.]